MKMSKYSLFLFLFVVMAFNLKAQRPYVETNAEFIELATQDLDAHVQDEKFLKEMAKQDIHGSYKFQITVGDKGR